MPSTHALTKVTALTSADVFRLDLDPARVATAETERGVTYATLSSSINQTIEHYGGVADGETDSTEALEAATADLGRKNIYFGVAGSTLGLNDYSEFYIIRDAFIDGNSLIGPANFTSDGTQTTSILRLGQDPDTPNGGQWRTRRVQDITFSGKLRADTGVSFGGEDGAVEEKANSWTIDGCLFERFHIGILKPEGNFGNRITDTSSTSGNYGYVAFGRTDPTISHIGNDTIERGEWAGHRKAAFFLDGKQLGGTGGTVFRDVIVESNPGFGIFVKDYNNAYNPLRLTNVWFENNATGGAVDMTDVGEGAALTPRDLYLENVDHCIVENSLIRALEVVDSNLVLDDCTFVASVTKLYDSSVGTGNFITVRNVQITSWGEGDVGAGLVIIESLDRVSTGAGTAANRMWMAPPRRPYTGNGIQFGTLLESTTFQEGNDWGSVGNPGAGDIARDGYVEGLTFPTAAQYTFTASDVFLGPAQSAATTTNGKWYVCTLEARLDANEANLGSVKFGSAYNHTRGDADELLRANAGQWVTLANVAELTTGSGAIRPIVGTTSGGTVTMSFGACQIVEFTNAQDAYDYYNAGHFALNTGKQRRVTQSDTARANDASPSADPYLKDYILDADTVYLVSGALIIDSNSAANFEWDFDFSQVPQLWRIAAQDGTTSGNVNSTVQDSASSLTIGGQSSVLIAPLSGMFKTNATTGGTMQFTWSQGTSNAYVTTLEEGSWLEICKAYNPS